ncbi:hydroxypyruvate isomerase family protein [Flavihumibacter petaseus]|uniref:Putative sugar isomerase n=1 Tax=Flavihumibacter petaseus NBRC 106054 TaxID=1220578 RepID=A0A0E9N4E0_9BACT|nr:TIM barrel protein [Flavihumibacter petaseus]GAO44230.1 putative sugar isomerase [Flavihumibacter petaseus NBRC 106054]
MKQNNSRRKAVKQLLVAGAGIALAPTAGFAAIEPAPETSAEKLTMKGNIRHSVCRWTYGQLSLDELCKQAKAIGISAIDLVGPKEWDTLKKYDLYSSMCNGAEINLTDGFCHTEYHDQLVKNYTDMIPQVAKAGYTNLICFSGNRKGLDDETGLKNSVAGLKRVIALAEKHKVVLHMELLNSRVDHKDYMCDRSAWGIELVKRLGSANFSLLFDIYHMQIDEGDIIRSIQNNYQYFGHYHTGGNPGRNEIDERQELNYPAIMKAIVATGFKGYVAQEFIPKDDDKIASLRKAVQLCDV